MPSVTNKRVPITAAILGDEYDYVVGVDTHAATHSYAIITAPTGALVDEQTFPTTPAGIARACEWISRRTGGEVSGVLISAEGTGSYGAVLSGELAQFGHHRGGAGLDLDGTDIAAPDRAGQAGAVGPGSLDAKGGKRVLRQVDDWEVGPAELVGAASSGVGNMD